MPDELNPATAAPVAPTEAEPEDLDATEAPICVLLRPTDMRDLHLLIAGYPLSISGLPSDREFEAMVRLRRVRVAFDVALQQAGFAPLQPPPPRNGQH